MFFYIFLQGYIPILRDNLLLNDIYQLVIAILYSNVTAILALTVTLELLEYCNPNYNYLIGFFDFT